MEGFLREKMQWDTVWKFITHNNRYAIRHCEITYQVYSSGVFFRNETFYSREKAERYCLDHQISTLNVVQKSSTQFKVRFVFNDFDEFRKHVLKHQPRAIHLGPIYYMEGRNGRAWECKHNLVRKPMVCDLDIDPVDRVISVRCPCKMEKKCCDICWAEWIRPRIREILHVYANIFQFKHILMEYSGGKGCHIYALDEFACEWTPEQRTRVVNMIQARGVVLDKEASVLTNRTCKIPLYMHAKTGRITVPIALTEWEQWLPSMAPTFTSVTFEQMQQYAQIVLNTLP